MSNLQQLIDLVLATKCRIDNVITLEEYHNKYGLLTHRLEPGTVPYENSELVYSKKVPLDSPRTFDSLGARLGLLNLIKFGNNDFVTLLHFKYPRCPVIKFSSTIEEELKQIEMTPEVRRALEWMFEGNEYLTQHLERVKLNN